MTRSAAVIAKGRARPFWFGCPVVFSGSVARVTGEPAAGDFIDVTDDRGQLTGRGFFNPASSYRVRIVGGPQASESADVVIRNRILRAGRLRRLIGLPGDETNVYRLFSSEGDGLSGLTVDIFDNTAVVMESAYWVSLYRSVIAEAVREAAGVDCSVIFRVASGMRRFEGMTASDEGQGAECGIEVKENGLVYQTRPGDGQKTGYYADQRDNRTSITRFVKDRKVLDLFCFSGGFAMNAARANAAGVTAVDSSTAAVKSGISNADLNGLVDRINFQQSDVMEFLKNAEQYDVVVCDPPKFVTGRKSLDAGLKHYRKLNSAAISHVADGGVFVTCSCSSLVRRDVFVSMLRDAAAEAGCEVTVLSVAGAGPDHPVNPAWTEGEYLKVATLAVSRTGRT